MWHSSYSLPLFHHFSPQRSRNSFCLSPRGRRLQAIWSKTKCPEKQFSDTLLRMVLIFFRSQLLLHDRLFSLLWSLLTVILTPRAPASNWRISNPAPWDLVDTCIRSHHLRSIAFCKMVILSTLVNVLRTARAISGNLSNTICNVMLVFSSSLRPLVQTFGFWPSFKRMGFSLGTWPLASIFGLCTGNFSFWLTFEPRLLFMLRVRPTVLCQRILLLLLTRIFQLHCFVMLSNSLLTNLTLRSLTSASFSCFMILLLAATRSCSRRCTSASTL